MLARTQLLRSFRTAGMLMVAFPALTILVPGSAPPSHFAYAIAALLAITGVALAVAPKPMVRRVAVAASLLVTASGIAALLGTGHPELTLPGHPAMMIVIGLYLAFRIVMVSVYAKQVEGGSVNDEDEPAPTPPPVA